MHAPGQTVARAQARPGVAVSLSRTLLVLPASPSPGHIDSAVIMTRSLNFRVSLTRTHWQTRKYRDRDNNLEGAYLVPGDFTIGGPTAGTMTSQTAPFVWPDAEAKFTCCK